jgi:hypothetical protein
MSSPGRAGEQPWAFGALPRDPTQLASVHNLSSHLVVRNAGGKWRRARDDIHSCFPRLSVHSFEQGNTNELGVRSRQLSQTAVNVSGVSSSDAAEVDASLMQFVNYTRRHSFRLPNPAISFPFLYVDMMSFLDYVPDRYLDAIEKWLVFDTEKCCRLKPDPDESVFVRTYTAFRRGCCTVRRCARNNSPTSSVLCCVPCTIDC